MIVKAIPCSAVHVSALSKLKGLPSRLRYSPRGGGVLPYESDEAASRKISTTPLKGTRI